MTPATLATPAPLPNTDAVNHARIMAALYAWIAKRPGLDPRNYISHGFDTEGRRAYRSESRHITAQKRDAERLLAEVARTGPHTHAAWADAFRAYSGRLTWNGQQLDYTAGQYPPTEYRAAVCAVAAALLWDRYRDHMSAPDGHALRQQFVSRFGARFAARWFA